MTGVPRSARRVPLLFLLGLVLPAAAQSGGMQNGPFDGMSSEIIVPAAVRVDGKNGAFFQTDLWIRCQTAPVGATLYFQAADAASAAPAVTVPMTLTQPVVYLPDVLSATFGVPKGAGNIRIAADAPVTAVFPEPGNRVNVSVVNTNSTTVSGVVEVLDSDGSAPSGTGVVSLPFSIAGYSSHQFNDVLANVHPRFGAGDTGLQVRVRLSQGSSGMVMAYAVVNDNATNDGYVVMGTMMNGGRGMGMMP